MISHGSKSGINDQVKITKQQKTLLADKGDIRVGGEYQVAKIPEVLADPAKDPAFEEDLEEQMWEPDRMNREQIERYGSFLKV